MASSGNFSTNKYSTSSHGTIGLNLAWSIKSQDPVTNRTVLNWTLKSNGSMSSGYYVQAGPVTATINGTKVVNTTSRFDMRGSGGYKKTGTITISHNTDGTKTVSMSISAAIYSASVNCKASKSYTINTINRYALISSVSEFNDETNPTIVYTNPAGTDLVTDLKICMKWKNALDEDQSTSYVNIPEEDWEGGSVTLNLDSYRTNLRNSCPNSNTLAVTFDMQSTMSGTDYHHTKTATMSIVNANPTLLSGILSYQDIDSTTVGRTGNNQIIVQGQSTLRVHADSSKATAQKGATISSYSLNFNEGDYTPDSSGNVAFIQPNYVGIYPAILTVTDSRGNSSDASVDITIHELVPPSAIYSLKREGNFYDQTILYVDGKVSSIAGTNAMTITGKYRKKGDITWVDEFTVPDAQNYYINGSTGLDNKFEWEVLVTVADKYYTRADAQDFPATTYLLVVGKGTPTAFFDVKRHSFSVNGFPDADEQLFVGGTIKAKPNETDGGVVLPHNYSADEQIVGYWVDGRPIYEKTVILASAVTISAGNTSAAGTWGVVQSGWDDEITPLSFQFYGGSSSGSDSNVWNHLTGQWYRTGKSIRAMNVRSSAVAVIGFTIRYFYGTIL